MYAIEKNVPVLGKPRGDSLYPFRQMEIGDSFFVPLKPGEKRVEVQGRVLATARTVIGSKKIITRSVEENGVEGIRVWRKDR